MINIVYEFCLIIAMGCTSSFPRSLKPQIREQTVSELLLTPHQKELIRSSWKLIQIKRTEVGVKVFLTLFKRNPALQSVFPEFRDLSLTELELKQELRGHSERVMRTVENSVNSMDDPDSLNEYLIELGRRHVMRSVKPSVNDLHLINRALLDTFQDTIPSSWRPEDAAAWEILLNFFTKKLKEGIRTGSKKIQVH
ncbi:neuroglobin-like [Acropora muricata]|uniref:neuroglobin-like n=1 Tax=Acropora muricata TaxID=159855 RepID=UPI0034E55405